MLHQTLKNKLKKKKEEQEEGERLQIEEWTKEILIYNSSKTEVRKYDGYEIVGTNFNSKIKNKISNASEKSTTQSIKA